jgi:hypothetical protein
MPNRILPKQHGEVMRVHFQHGRFLKYIEKQPIHINARYSQENHIGDVTTCRRSPVGASLAEPPIVGPFHL